MNTSVFHIVHFEHNVFMERENLLKKAHTARRESRQVEFKGSFDVRSTPDWCELIKDIVAIANSGGGIIIFGLKSNGTPSGLDCSDILGIDLANITNKITPYTDGTFQSIEVEEIERNGLVLPSFLIEQVKIPIIFINPGTYSIPDGKQKTAFARGTVYFRHGAKSEPGNSADIREVIERNIELNRKAWLSNIRKVVNAPIESRIEVLSSNIIATTDKLATPIRITTDKDAPSYHLIDPNDPHPFRGKDVLNQLDRHCGTKLNQYYLQCIQREFKIDESRPDFYYRPLYGSSRFSANFIDWLIEEYKKDKDFFEVIRRKFVKHK
jgi:hypothetical protein